MHEYFDHERPLDFMVFCSFQSGVFGNPSQAQYAAGNTYQDALAHYRRAQGLKVVSVNLGIMRDVGVLAETGSRALKAWEEVLGIGESAFHALMKSLINGQMPKRDVREDEAAVQICTGLGTATFWLFTISPLLHTSWTRDLDHRQSAAYRLSRAVHQAKVPLSILHLGFRRPTMLHHRGFDQENSRYLAYSTVRS